MPAITTPAAARLPHESRQPGALNAFAATGENPINYIVRHMNLDSGSLGAEGQLHNLRAVREGTRVFSTELRDGTRIWTILLPQGILTF